MEISIESADELTVKRGIVDYSRVAAHAESNVLYLHSVLARRAKEPVPLSAAILGRGGCVLAPMRN